MDPDIEVVLARFEPVAMDEEQFAKLAAVRELTRAYVRGVIAVCPDGRYRSLALTDLERVAGWAVKAVTHG